MFFTLWEPTSIFLVYAYHKKMERRKKKEKKGEKKMYELSKRNKKGIVQGIVERS